MGLYGLEELKSPEDYATAMHSAVRNVTHEIGKTILREVIQGSERESERERETFGAVRLDVYLCLNSLSLIIRGDFLYTS